jgi:hypothetical protein
MKELQDQLEAEQYFSRLYKTQSNDAKEELEEKLRQIQELEEERGNLMHQLQIALARADSEALARSIAEETVADLEKEKTMKELEHKDLITKHRNELSTKEAALQSLKDIESEKNKTLNKMQYEVDDLMQQNRKMQDELNKLKLDNDEMEKLKAKLKTETILKQQAVNKLAEIMNRKDNNLSGKQKTKVSSTADLRKKEKENKKLQQELSMERAKYDDLCLKHNDIISQLSKEIDVSGRDIDLSRFHILMFMFCF